MDFVQFFEMILNVDQTLGIFIDQYGTLIYVILFAIVFCETGLVVLPFLPGDSLLFIAGAFCATAGMAKPARHNKLLAWYSLVLRRGDIIYSPLVQFFRLLQPKTSPQPGYAPPDEAIELRQAE